MGEALKKIRRLRHSVLTLEIQLSMMPSSFEANGAMEAAKDIKKGIEELKNILQEADKNGRNN